MFLFLIYHLFVIICGDNYFEGLSSSIPLYLIALYLAEFFMRNVDSLLELYMCTGNRQNYMGGWGNSFSSIYYVFNIQLNFRLLSLKFLLFSSCSLFVRSFSIELIGVFGFCIIKFIWGTISLNLRLIWDSRF